MVHYLAQLANGRCDSPIAIAPLVVGVDVGNLRLQAGMLVALLGHPLLIVESTTRNVSQFEQARQRKVLP